MAHNPRLSSILPSSTNLVPKLFFDYPLLIIGSHFQLSRSLSCHRPRFSTPCEVPKKAQTEATCSGLTSQRWQSHNFCQTQLPVTS
jgi:hypothetical protein